MGNAPVHLASRMVLSALLCSGKQLGGADAVRDPRHPVRVRFVQLIGHERIKNVGKSQ